MLKSIFYKEFTKTRVGIIVVSTVILAVLVFSIISLSHDIRLVGATQFLSMRIVSGWTTSNFVNILPIAAGLTLAIVQYVPEAAYGRLKLTLHLPMKENEIVLMMCVYGWVVLACISLVSLVLLTILELLYLPMEMVVQDVVETVRWMLSSFIAYNMVTAACLERTSNGMLRWGFIGLVLIGALFVFPPKTVETFILTIVLVVMSAAAPYVCTRRYKAGL